MQCAAWIPGWYELDPQLEIGLEGEFIFFRNVPDHLKGPEELVLYNSLFSPNEMMFATGRITAIRHPELGVIRKVDTRGLDYTITSSDGTMLIVNAEENPGNIFENDQGRWVESQRQVTSWRFCIEFDNLSEVYSESRCRRRKMRG